MSELGDPGGDGPAMDEPAAPTPASHEGGNGPADAVDDGDRTVSGDAAVEHVAEGFGFNTEKVAGEGEDGPPVIVRHPECTFLAVFDGLGGAGAERLTDPDDPEHRVKAAYLASRAASAALEALLAESVPGRLDELRPELERRLDEALSELQATHVSTSRVKSRLKRPFPTTLAFASVAPVPDALHVELLWAGDSRVFALLADRGLVQLTRDHVLVDDGSTDAPMTRALNAGSTSLDHHAVELPADAIVFAATDGCFGYWPTLAHFEYELLESMANAPDVAAWGGALSFRIAKSTGDDASMALVAPMSVELAALSDRFAGRRSFLHKLVACFDRPTESERAWLWRMYRPDYERLLPPAGIEAVPEPGASDAADEAATESTDLTGEDVEPPSVGEAPDVEVAPIHDGAQS